jgi:hypothetical protein
MECFLRLIIQVNLSYTVYSYSLAYMHFGCEFPAILQDSKPLPVDHFVQAIGLL